MGPKRILLGVLACALLFVSVSQAQELELQVELMNALGTGISKKGDTVSGRVISPSAFQGDTVEGKVTNSKAGSGLNAKSVLIFSFEILKHAGQDIPISSEVKAILNSRGRVDVDDEGHAIKKSNNFAKAAGITGAGALIGGLIGGKKGAAIGAASGAIASIVLIEVATEGPSINLAQSSRVTLLAKSLSGPALASLTPNQASAAPSAPVSTTAATVNQSYAPAATPSATTQANSQPNLTAVKSDFIPGDKDIYYDDFSDMAGDEPPPHWKVRGGTAELRTGEGIRQLTMTARGMTLTPNLTGLPKNFTMETNMAYKGHGGTTTWRFHNKAGAEVFQIYAAVNYANLFLVIKAGDEELTSQQIQMDWSQPVKMALWIQNGRVRFYVNSQRVMDINQINLPELGKLEVYVDGPGSNDPAGYVGFRFVRFAETSPDFSQVISFSGRYVTHGILFDTDSDQIKAESAPVIKMIAKGLETNPALKLLIEGHTDSVGSSDHNLDLSRQRAEAVKSVLVSQFNVDASRLTTVGLGATKPTDSNDTAQGRAQNRRVEFVKQ